MVLNEKGQAALTDAMFLLAIVSGLSVMMFLFIADYGLTIERAALDFYGTDYATSALQTLLYSSTPRDPNEFLSTAKEIDYLLAFLKEDYANERKLGGQSKALLVKDLNLVLSSSLATHDFIFVMRTVSADLTQPTEFVFIALKYTEFDAGTGEVSPQYYYFEPKAGYENIIEEKLLTNAGSVVKAQPVVLRFSTTDGKTDSIHTVLDMWPVTPIDSQILTGPDDLNCSPVP